jgi:hypothetical protein
MTVAELSRLLYDLNVPPDLYRLDGTHFELAHVLARRDSQWVVFLSERAGESGAVVFDDEHRACIHLLGCIFVSLVERRRIQVTDPQEA